MLFILFTELSYPSHLRLAVLKPMGANVYHVPGLYLLGIGGAPYISHKIIAQNHIFSFSTSSLKQPAGGISYYAGRLPKSRLP